MIKSHFYKKLFIATIAFSSFLGIHTVEAATKKAVPTAKGSSSIEKMERELIDMINAERTQHNLPALSYSPELTECARNHSTNMANKTVSFGHDGFKDRMKEMSKKIKLSTFGENVAYSSKEYDHLQTAVKGWMKSQSHKDNILDKGYNITGIGISFNNDNYCYLTQLFAKVPSKK